MGVELHDNRGLICGFHLQSQGPAIAIEIAAVSAIEPPAGALWLHFNLNDGRARTWIGGCAWLPAEGRERLLGSERSAFLEVSGNAITGALADVYSDDPERFGLVYVYVDQNCLISGRRHPVTAAALLHADLAAGLPIETTPALFNRLFTHLVASLYQSRRRIRGRDRPGRGSGLCRRVSRSPAGPASRWHGSPPSTVGRRP